LAPHFLRIGAKIYVSIKAWIRDREASPDGIEALKAALVDAR
jgi:hypothetical protein